MAVLVFILPLLMLPGVLSQTAECPVEEGTATPGEYGVDVDGHGTCYNTETIQQNKCPDACADGHVCVPDIVVNITIIVECEDGTRHEITITIIIRCKCIPRDEQCRLVTKRHRKRTRSLKIKGETCVNKKRMKENTCQGYCPPGEACLGIKFKKKGKVFICPSGRYRVPFKMPTECDCLEGDPPSMLYPNQLECSLIKKKYRPGEKYLTIDGKNCTNKGKFKENDCDGKCPPGLNCLATKYRVKDKWFQCDTGPDLLVFFTMPARCDCIEGSLPALPPHPYIPYCTLFRYWRPEGDLVVVIDGVKCVNAHRFIQSYCYGWCPPGTVCLPAAYMNVKVKLDCPAPIPDHTIILMMPSKCACFV